MERILVWENDQFSSEEFTKEDIAFLIRKFGGFCTLGPATLTVNRLVESVTLPSKRILIINSRKAPSASILGWLSFVDPRLSALHELQISPQMSSDGDIFSLLAKLFCRELLKAVSINGKLRKYNKEKISDSYIRGAINFSQVARLGGDVTKIPCSVWQRSTNNELNQIFLAALNLVRRNPFARNFCGMAFSSLFEIFSNGKIQDVNRQCLTKYKLSRGETQFQNAFNLAQMLLLSSNLSDGHDHFGFCFTLNLETLFEKTVGIAFKRINQATKCSYQITYNTIHASGEKRPKRMILDSFIPWGRGANLVVDAKFKERITTANIQQIVSYCLAVGSDRAVLVVPNKGSTEESVIEFPIASTFSLSIKKITIHIIGMRTDASNALEWENAVSEFCLLISKHVLFDFEIDRKPISYLNAI